MDLYHFSKKIHFNKFEFYYNINLNIKSEWR